MDNGKPQENPAQEPRRQRARNIQGMFLPLLSQPDQPKEIEELYKAIVEKGREAMLWYPSARRATRSGGGGCGSWPSC